MMTEMEQDIAGRVVGWAMNQDAQWNSNQEMCEDYWREQLDIRDLNKQSYSGLEMPHEELNLNSVVYTGSHHSYCL